MKDFISKWEWSKVKKYLFRTVIIISFAILLILYLKHAIFSYYIDLLAQRTTLSNDLIKVIGALILIPYWIGFSYIFSVSKRKRYTGYSILVILFIFFYLGMHFATPKGTLGTWYVITDDCEVEYFPRYAERDPITGQTLKTVTADIIPYLKLVREHGCNPINPQTAEFFNPRTGEPQVYYTRHPDGEFEFFYAQVYDRYGNRSNPISSNVLQEWEAWLKGQKIAEDELKSKRIAEQERLERQRAEEDRLKRIREEEEKERKEEKAFREMYINTSLLSQLKNNNKVALTASESGLYTHQILEALNSRGVNAHSGVLKQQIFKSNIYSSIVNGDRNLFKRLGLADLNGNLVLYNITFENVRNPDGLLKSIAYLNTSIIPLKGGSILHREFTARGSGFNETDAKSSALASILEKFIQDPDMADVLDIF